MAYEVKEPYKSVQMVYENAVWSGVVQMEK